MSLPSIAMNRGQFILSNIYSKSNQFSRISSIVQTCTKRRFNTNVLAIENTPCIPIAETNLTTFNTKSIQSLGINFSYQLTELWNNLSTWLIKRTFQPSIIRKRRKTGFLTRQKTVGGRRVLERRRKKGRARLGGC